jgi:leucyl-tRNA synthetase
MSKSKNNGVDPQDLIEKYGADTARLYTMFTAPPEATLEWNDAGVEGSYRFLRRVWDLAAREKKSISYATARNQNLSGVTLAKDEKSFRREVHLILKQASYDYDRMQYNTVVSACMKLLNLAHDAPTGAHWGNGSLTFIEALVAEAMSILLRILYPVCPHIAHTLWVELGYATMHGDLLDAPWPQVDPTALVQDEIELVLQINGKLRGALVVPSGASKEAIEALALTNPTLLEFAAGAAPKKVIVVPGRLVNVVI